MYSFVLRNEWCTQNFDGAGKRGGLSDSALFQRALVVWNLVSMMTLFGERMDSTLV